MLQRDGWILFLEAGFESECFSFSVCVSYELPREFSGVFVTAVNNPPDTNSKRSSTITWQNSWVVPWLYLVILIKHTSELCYLNTISIPPSPRRDVVVQWRRSWWNVLCLRWSHAHAEHDYPLSSTHQEAKQASHWKNVRHWMSDFLVAVSRT